MENKTIKMSFKPKSRLLLQLGDQLIKNEKVAISELVKNSYDACSRYTTVKLIDVHKDGYEKRGKILIEDDGIGMDKDIIQSIWMELGTNFKEKIKENFEHTELDNKECFGLPPIGEKGIGRFGVHKLGYKIKLISKKKNSQEIEVNIN